MAGHEHSSGALHEDETHAHVVPPVSTSLTIFAILAGLALLALFIGFSDLGPLKVVASLACATVQAGVLAYFFMELKQADKLTWLVVATSVFFVGIQFLFTMTDYLTRHLGVL